ncbi:MAG: hypothetical protein DMG11_12410 [Acidobacteria bacterium]|nr:MAG: hypothetical protein DMG11_12410 [Acidobacteriota bacterium]
MIILLSLGLLLAPIKTENGRFTIYQDGKRIGTEDFSVVQRQQGYLVEGRTSIGEVKISSRMELNEKLTPTFYEYSDSRNTIRVKIENPISELETTISGKSSSADFRFPEGGVILDNNFFHHYLILLYRVQLQQTFFPVFVPQDMRVGGVSVRATGARTYDLEAGEVKLQATTDAEGRLVRLEVPEKKVVVER